MPVALAFGLGALVLMAVLGVLGIGLWTGYRNTVDLIHEKAALLVSAAETQTRQYLEVAELQAEFIARMITSGETEPGPSEEFLNVLFGALATTPQMIAILYVDAASHLTGAERLDGETAPLFQNVREDTELQAALEAARQDPTPRWGEIIWRQAYGEPLLNLHHPVMRDGRFEGLVLVLVSPRRLSELISDIEGEFGHNAFILYGRDAVLAHPLMAFGYPGLNRLQPLPRQDRFGDPVLAKMWRTDEEIPWLQRLLLGGGVHAVPLGDAVYVYLYRELDGFSDRPLLIGTYLRARDLYAEVGRLGGAVVLCLAILLVFIVVAVLVGHRIARPVRRLAEGARRIHGLELDDVEEIPPSFFRELNDAAEAFNAMLHGLQWFERYVPKALVMRLMRLHGVGALASSNRMVVVMFTDVAGFTTLSEGMSAERVGAFLNHHFALIAACVEAEDGTIDKYIGDSLMAFWGAPEAHPDAADRACRTATAIARTVAADNRARQEKVRLRIGIHAGPVVVGNIGAPGRIDYTVVGDTVNAAQRLEEMGKQVEDHREVTILLSESTLEGTAAATRDALGPALRDLGTHELRGRREPLRVFLLDPARAGAPPARRRAGMAPVSS